MAKFVAKKKTFSSKNKPNRSQRSEEDLSEKKQKKKPFVSWREKKEAKRQKINDDQKIDETEIVSHDYKPPVPVYNSDDDDEDMSGTEMQQKIINERKKKNKSGGGGFQSMGLSYPVYRSVMKKGYKIPTPIQRKTIPMIMEGKDVVAMARTGSGKTAAFLIPLMEKLKVHSCKIGARGLILSPTRELAAQTYKFALDFAKFTDLKITIILGGDSMESQFEAMHSNPDIIIATPGRLLHVLVEMDKKKLSQIQYVVFDEADRLFELGFQEQLQELLNRLPEARQTLLFSATLPKLLVEFAKAGLNEPELIRLDVENKLSESLKTSFICCREEDKEAILIHLLKTVIHPEDMTVVFVATRHHVEFIQELLAKADITSTHVYSSLDAEARKINISLFRSKKVRVMIVTDLAARGIDIPLLDNVINFNFPSSSKLFIHRVGRVARAGRTGSAYSLVSPDESPYLFELHMFLDRPLKLASHDMKDDEDGLCGSVPQDIIDEESDAIKTWMESVYEFSSMKKVCKNAMKQYVKSRSLPSSESVKKAKELLHFETMVSHPMFRMIKSKDEQKSIPKNNEHQEEDDTKRRSNLLLSLKSYKPSATIFEINSSKKNSSSSDVMINKRKAHDSIVEKKLRGIKTSDDGVKKDFKDDQFYLTYKPDHHETEKGLEINDVNAKSSSQLDSAILDVVGDEDSIMRKQKSNVKWDRKKKKFINENDVSSEKKQKKIRTESGVWIPASYSSDLYKKWKERQKIDFDDSKQDGDDDTPTQLPMGKKIRRRDGRLMTVRSDFKPGFGRKRRGGMGPDDAKSNKTRGRGRPPKRELKRTEEILKVRLKEEKKRKIIESKNRAKTGMSDGRHKKRGGKR